MCHPERSEGSLARLRPADPTHVTLGLGKSSEVFHKFEHLYTFLSTFSSSAYFGVAIAEKPPHHCRNCARESDWRFQRDESAR